MRQIDCWKKVRLLNFLFSGGNACGRTLSAPSETILTS
jgi:hypothetical protein